MLLTTLLMFIGACIVLAISAEFLVKGLTKVSYYLRLTEFVVGFMIVAVATSIPELFIGITSALNKYPVLSLGNVIGANIIDLTLVIGIASILRRGIRVETKAVKVDTLYMFIIMLLPIILMFFDHEISRLDGCILLVAFFLYIFRLLGQEKRFRETIDHIPRKEFFTNVAISAISLVLLFLSANMAVKSATSLAVDLSIEPILIGLFILSIGSTLPELTFESTAILERHKYMALGDLIGSIVVNSTLVLGITAIICPIRADFLLFLTSSFFMITVAFLFMTFVECEKHILWQEGVALILLYILFVIVEITISSMRISIGI